MSVDSEIIFALVESRGTSPDVLEELVGAMAAAWIDERRPDVLHVARGIGRPLWIARGPNVARVSPRTGKVLHLFPTPVTANIVVFEAGSVWVASQRRLASNAASARNVSTRACHSACCRVAVRPGCASAASMAATRAS